MATTRTNREVVPEAALIQTAREALKAAAARISSRGYDAAGIEAFRLGKLHEAIDEAEEALFNVLNTGDSYLGCVACTRAINISMGRAPEYGIAQPEPEPEATVHTLPSSDDHSRHAG